MALLALLFSAASARAQQPWTVEQFAPLVGNPAQYSQDDLLKVASEDCLAFVPVEADVRAFHDTRPALGPNFETSLLRKSCFRNVRFRNLAEEVSKLLEYREPLEVGRLVQLYMDACTEDMSYTSLRGVARSGATEGTIRQLADGCGIDINPRTWEVALRVGYAPLKAADEIRAQQMEFQSGTELSAMLVHYLHENITAAVEVERTRYFFGSGGLDFDADGTFHHTSVSLSGGYILSCMWRTGCGDHLLSTFDIYGRAAVAYGFLNGDVDLAGDPPLDGTVGFSFNGPGLGGEVGFVYYITRVLGVAIELGHSWILFDRVTVDTGDEELTDRISGTSGRTHFGVSLQTRFPF